MFLRQKRAERPIHIDELSTNPACCVWWCYRDLMHRRPYLHDYLHRLISNWNSVLLRFYDLKFFLQLETKYRSPIMNHIVMTHSLHIMNLPYPGPWSYDVLNRLTVLAARFIDNGYIIESILTKHFRRRLIQKRLQKLLWLVQRALPFELKDMIVKFL